ncbi:hypothetical protein AXG93_4148s1000 [Marchantia polymorpha subsp. ruderalis]|uniref:Uncharacterized protein n=1 Tax=Marchantia polymorpha subsp. ruderalis TaxID=1480154 RepID=A0A176W2R3_MARPO|nr:hypothetical protein AXG93_4148s1000 [Marchantia polymorpha subsp. ruderalis]
MFEKDSVKITRAEEFTFAPLFNHARSRMNGWKTADPMRRVIALSVMHILQPQRLMYVTACALWEKPLMNHLTPYIVNFYRGTGLLTKAEEKRFPKEREILKVESNKGTEEEDNSRSRMPSRTTTSGIVQVDVLPTRERPKRRIAKRRKVMTDDKEDPLLESRMTDSEITGI